jgi:hypothetical protein
MCDPVVLAGLALSAGSAVVNSMAATDDAKARDNVLAAERIRQRGFDQETMALNNQSQNRYVGFEPQMQDRAQSLGDYLSSRVAPDPNSTVPSALPSSSSGVVNQEVDKQRGEAQAFVDQQTGAMADMRSFGDLLGEISIGQARDAGQIGTVGGFKRGSNGIVPLELNQAAKTGDDMRLFGDILGGAGSIATGYGIGGGSRSLAEMFMPGKVVPGLVAPTPLPRPSNLYAVT